MHVNWSQLGNYLYGNRVAIETTTILVVSAGIKTLPVPGQPFSPYTWLYDWSHQFLNITNTRLNSTPTVTPPETAPIPNVSK